MLFKQELALLVKAKFSFFCKDVESLPIRAEAQMLASLAFLGMEFHFNYVLRLM
jgi:hypothetical protein